MRESSGYLFQFDAGVSIKQILPRRGVEVYDGFILRMDHRQMRRNLFQYRHSRRLVINEDPPLAAGSNFAPQNQRAILRVQTVGLEDPFDGTRRGSVILKDGSDHGSLGARADHIG